MLSRWLLASLSIATLFCATDAQAQGDDDEPWVLPLFGETSFSLTSTTLAQYRLDNFDSNEFNDNFFSLTERVDMELQGEELSAGLRLDGFLPVFPGRDGAGPSIGNQCPVGEEWRCTIEWDLRPERVLVRFQRDGWDLIVGDSYAVFGRGMALSLRKVDSVGVDTTVRGLQIRFEEGRLFAQLLGGYANTQNLDPVNLSLIEEHPDLLAGARVGFRLGEYEDMELAFHGVRLWSLQGCGDNGLCDFVFSPLPDQSKDVTASVLGWNFSVPALLDGQLSVYVEANMMLREDEYVDLVDQETERHWGRAVYASTQLNVGGLTALLEWKDYHDFLLARSNGQRAFHVYSTSPTTDLDSERQRGAANSRGGALRVSYAIQPGPWSVAIGGLGYAHEDESRGADPTDGILATHLYAQVTRENHASPGELGWTFEVLGGYRREFYLHDPAGEFFDDGDVESDVIHAQVEVGIFSGDHGVDVTIQNREERQAGFMDYQTFRRGGVAVTYAYGPNLSLSPALRWSTEREATQPILYPSLELRWVFDHGRHLRLFGGRNPGGRVCSGGVCRDVPPFQGVQAELVYRL